jgi:hypothetical protein
MKAKQFALITLFLGINVQNIKAQISITSSSFSYSQDFNTLSNTSTSSTVPTGWAFLETGTSARVNQIYTSDDGGGNAGDTYSYGTGNDLDRAFGEITTGTITTVIGVSFTNNTGQILNALTVAYVGECWRVGTKNRFDRLDFQYSLNADSLNHISATWTDVNQLDFITPDTTTTGIKDGNLSANRTTISHSITGLNLANGSKVWFRWTSNDASGSDDGLAVDDFSLSNITLPIQLLDFKAKAFAEYVQLNWSTLSEKNTEKFEIQRFDGTSFQTIGSVEAKGDLAGFFNYELQDLEPMFGENYYRLLEIETNGNAHISKVITTVFEGSDKNLDFYCSASSGKLSLQIIGSQSSGTSIKVSDLTGRIILDQQLNINKGANALEFPLQTEGLHLISLQQGSKQLSKKVLITQ